MVVLKQNSCNLDEPSQGVPRRREERATSPPSVDERPSRASRRGGVDVDKLTRHLAQTCSIMEALDASLPDGDAKKFTWQRNGDLRYSFFYWVDRPEPTMPLGYGPSSADPQTGEIISASLYNYGAALDSYAQTSADAVELLNSQISVDDLLSGKTIADVLKTDGHDVTRRATPSRSRPRPRPWRSRACRRRRPRATRASSPCRAVSPPRKMSLIKGTAVEQMMMTPDILAVKLPNSKPGDQLTPTSSRRRRRRPGSRRMRTTSACRPSRPSSTNGCVYLGEFADDAILGLAARRSSRRVLGADALEGASPTDLPRPRRPRDGPHDGPAPQLRGLDRRAELRRQLLEHPRDHAARRSGTRRASASTATRRSWTTARASTATSTASASTTTRPSASATASSSTSCRRPPDERDRRAAPERHPLQGLHEAADARGRRRQPAGRRRAPVRGDPHAAPERLRRRGREARSPRAGTFITPERPYKFCSDEFIGNLDCKQWDFGANQQEIVNDSIDRFKNYFVFNAFKRGRLNWTIDGYLNRLLERYFIRYIGGVPVLLLLRPGVRGHRSRRRPAHGVDELAQRARRGAADARAGPALPDGGEPQRARAAPIRRAQNACLPGQPTMNIQIPDGKPYYINFSDDYYYRITRAGSLYEKLAALIALTSTQAHFYRVDTFADSSQYAINFYSVFKDEMVNLLSGVIRNDPSSYGGYVPTTGATTGLVPADARRRPRRGSARPSRPSPTTCSRAPCASTRPSTRRSSTTRSASRSRTSTRPGTARSTSRTTWPSRSRARRTTSPTRRARRSSSTRTRRAASPTERP